MNPDNKLDEGQKVVLTCEILVNKVSKKNIVWKKDDVVITDGLSKNK